MTKDWLKQLFTLVLLSGALLGSTARARAQAAKTPTDAQEVTTLGQSAGRPWASGVSSERQQAATARFLEGNMLLTEGLLIQASEKYREALKLWDHPGIHYNLALALLNLDQPLEVHAHLKSAMKYGASPLDQQKFELLQRYLLLVEKQLAPIEVRCDAIGATVSLDGRVLFQSPGQYKALLLPGPHTVKAVKPGFATTQRTRTLLPGKPTSLTLELYTNDELIEYRRRWPIWGPVVITGAGAALLTTGYVLGLHAQKRFDDYDQRIASDPGCQTGCTPSRALVDKKDEGERFRTLSTISYVSGGAALAGGIVLIVLNRSVPYRIDENERERGATLWPRLGPHEAGLVGSASF